MADTCREQILAALLAKLQGIAGIAGLTVERDRRAPVDAVPFLVLREGAEEPLLDWSGEDGYALSFDVEMYAGGNNDALTIKALTDLRGKAEAAIFADRTLAGKVRRIEMSDEMPPQPNPVEGHPNTRAGSRRYTVEYATREGDPLTFA